MTAEAERELDFLIRNEAVARAENNVEQSREAASHAIHSLTRAEESLEEAHKRCRRTKDRLTRAERALLLAEHDLVVQKDLDALRESEGIS